MSHDNSRTRLAKVPVIRDYTDFYAFVILMLARVAANDKSEKRRRGRGCKSCSSHGLKYPSVYISYTHIFCFA